MNHQIIYEFPLNERMRLFIRLEHLFQQFDHFMAGRSVWDARVVVDSLVDIVGVFARNDIKAETLLEIERQLAALNRVLPLAGGVDTDKLRDIMERLDQLGKRLYSKSGKVGLMLMDDDLFKSISQRSSIPGGTCSFDSPAYHYWLHRSEHERMGDIQRWMQPFMEIRSAISILLELIRTSAMPHQELAQLGFYQKTLERGLAFQLLRVGIDSSEPFYAEISGGKHRFSIRFMSRGLSGRSSQLTEDVRFQLTCCLF